MATDPRQMSTQELEQLIRSGSSLSSPREQPISKSTAISLAMKSLQERVAVLEDRNAQFSLQLEEKTAQIAKLQQDNSVLLDANRKLIDARKTLEEELATGKEARSREIEQRQILEDHRRVLEGEIERSQKLFQLDKEKLTLEVDHLKQILGERVDSERNLLENLKKTTQEKATIDAEYEKTKKALEDLRKIHEKSQGMLESALEKAESDLVDTKKRLSQSVKDLEKENKSLQETIKAQKESISRLRQEYAQVAKQKSVGNSSRMTPIREQRKKPPRRQSYSHIETEEIPVKDRPNTAVCDSDGEEKMLEESLMQCNSRYKELLQRSQIPGGGAKGVREEMKALAMEMEAKSEALYAIKAARGRESDRRR